MADEKNDQPTFEASLKKLEKAVDKLEQGNLPLSDALKLFEDGLKASNVCRERLEEAKQKVEVLVKDAGGDFSLSDLDDEDVDLDDSDGDDDEEESGSADEDEIPF